MKVLLAEYTTAHDPALAREGRAMLDILARELHALRPRTCPSRDR